MKEDNPNLRPPLLKEGMHQKQLKQLNKKILEWNRFTTIQKQRVAK